MICVNAAAEPPILIFDNGFSWKQVFDAGFRPKHSAGGQIICECVDQDFFLEIKGLSGMQYFSKGRLSFYFDHREELTAVGYIDNLAVGMEEGKKIADNVTQYLGDYVTHPIKMPQYIEGTYVDATGTHNFIGAVIGNYDFHYRFLDTASPVKQLMPKFFFNLNETKAKVVRTSIHPERKIKPPPGYEDYDMTEVRRLPDPNWRENQRKMKGESEPNNAIVREARKKALPPPASESSSRSSFWWPFCMAILFLAGVGWYIKRRFWVP
jgi:hypothetical protein